MHPIAPLDRPLILASQSPRRRQLLAEAGFTFTVEPLDIDESFPADLPAAEVAPYLARKKAAAGQHLLGPESILLTADSVVILEGEIYNKPQDYAEGFAMLSRLSGKMHQVITGVCLKSLHKEVTLAGESRVYFGNLSEEEIDYYLQTYQPYDKAGAYGIQEWIGWCKVTRLEGTYSNVMGLPVDLVYQALLAF